MKERHLLLFLIAICHYIYFSLVKYVTPLSSTDVKELVAISPRVVIRSLPCSTTCGLGVSFEELCQVREDGTYWDCLQQRVPCLLTWQCGLQTFTIETGGRVNLNCLRGVVDVKEQFHYIFSWSYARGIITTDDSLFVRWPVVRLDRLNLDPVREQDAGTYRCDVQDPTFRMVKRIYFGVKVLPVRVLYLNFTGAISNWDTKNGIGGSGLSASTGAGLVSPYTSPTLLEMFGYSLCISVLTTIVIFLLIYYLAKFKF